MISQISSLSLSAASAASRETDRSRYRASGSAAPGTRSNVSAAAEPRRQRAAGDLLDHAETHRARQPRRRQAMTGRFLKLQQATRVAEQHLAIVGKGDTARCPPEQGPFGLELKPLDLLAHRRLRQVEPLRGAVETAAIGHGNKGTQQLKIKHAIDPIFRSIILRNIVSIINDDLI